MWRRITLSALTCMVVVMSARVSGSVLEYGSDNPGVMVTLSPKGLDYLLRELLDKDCQVLNRLKLTDMSGHTKFGNIKWNLFNMKFSEFHKPFSRITVSKDHVTWGITGITFIIDGQWSIKKWLTDSGTFKAHLGADIIISGRIGMGHEKKQLFSINVTSCEAHHDGAITIDVRDGKSWTHPLMYIIDASLKSYARNTMKTQVCSAMTKKLNEGLFGELHIAMNDAFNVYVKQVLPPVVNEDLGIRAYFSGEVYLNGSSPLGPNNTIHAPPLPLIHEKQTSMVSILMTSFFWDTFLSSAAHGGFLDFNMDPSRDLPPQSGVYFDTTCIKVCIGNFVPLLQKKYPKRYISVDLWPGNKYVSSIHSDGIVIKSSVESTFYITDNGTRVDLFNVTMGSRVMFNVSVKPPIITIKGYLVTFDLTHIKTTSTIGSIPVVAVNILFEQIKKLYLHKKINDLLGIGVNPRNFFETVKQHFYVEDVTATLQEGAMIVHMEVVIGG